MMEPASTGRRRPGAGPAALFAVLLTAGLWGWSRGLDGPYVFDDNVTPLSDPASQSLSAWRENVQVTLRPVAKLTYAAEATGAVTSTPASRRAVSIAMLAISAVLLLFLIWRLAPDVGPYGAAGLAAVWFIHPVHADSVLLASGRTAVLANLFVLGALLACSASRRWRMAALFALACLSRETAIAALLPLVLLAISMHQGRWKTAISAVTPAVVAALVAVLWLVSTPRYMELAGYSLFGRPFLSSVYAQVGAVPVGMGLLFIPGALAIDYGIPLPASAADPLFILGLVMYVVAIGLVLVFRRSPAVSVGAALWLCALSPTQSIVPKLDALSNRPLSLALAGLVVAVAPLLGAAVRHSRRRLSFMQWGPGRAATLVLVAACIASMTSATAHRADLFRSELRLWQDAAQKSRVNERPLLQYAVLLQREGRVVEAREAVASAARINPFSLHVDVLSRALRPREVR